MIHRDAETPPPQSLPWGHWLYRIVACLLAGPLLAWLWLRGAKEEGYRRSLWERLGFVRTSPSACGGLWLHVASVGEAQAALTLLPSLMAQWGDTSLTWTTQTPAAKQLLRNRLPAESQVFFAPLDTPGSVRRFLRRAAPRTLVLLERELWPEWLWQCERHAVDVALINARLQQGSQRRWPYATAFMRQRLSQLKLVLCADAASAERFSEMGLPEARVHNLGNLKFDQPLVPAAQEPLTALLKHRRVIVAASTHALDEDALLPGWTPFIQQHKPPGASHLGDWLLVVAPRHPQRFAEVARRLQDELGLQAGQGLAIRSQAHAVTPETQVLLLDTIGELAHTYASAWLCLMGGTWAPVGGHNALEPLGAGCPVLFGPHTYQFPDLYASMAQHRAAQRAEADQLWDAVAQLAVDPERHADMRSAARRFVAAQQGSAQRTLQHLRTLPSWPVKPMPAIVAAGPPHDMWWVNSRLASTQDIGIFQPAAHIGRAVHMATGSGRGQAYRVEHHNQTWVLRHYRRGGWIARWVQDTYPASPTASSRAMEEFLLLREMVSVGLPVPEPVAARCQRTRPGWGRHSRYRADIAVVCLPQTLNLVQHLHERALGASVWYRIGQAIAQLHRHQIFHSDLNAHNLLVNDQQDVFIIDFDKCRRRAGHGWKPDNLARLLRSLRKEQKIHNGAWHWTESADWPALLQGYDAKA